MAIIAGHNFRDTPQGRQCEACGRLWTAIASASEADIAAERDRIWAAVWEAAR